MLMLLTCRVYAPAFPALKPFATVPDAMYKSERFIYWRACGIPFSGLGK